MATLINTYITTFAGLPPVVLRLPPSTPVSSLHAELRSSLPPFTHRLRLTTTSGRGLVPTSHTPLSELTPSSLLPLRLTVPLCGGKGGFGSQLRAAGGRMSSRKKSQENSDSCRNLDGRRLRTVKEAKALAAYLEIKPEMEKKEREERMKRWRAVVEAAEQGADGGKAKRFDDTEWVESVEESKEAVREAVDRALREYSPASSGEDTEPGSSTRRELKFGGWDEDEEFMSDSGDEMETVQEEDGEEDGEGGEGGEGAKEEVQGKGKGKANA